MFVLKIPDYQGLYGLRSIIDCLNFPHLVLILLYFLFHLPMLVCPSEWVPTSLSLVTNCRRAAVCRLCVVFMCVYQTQKDRPKHKALLPEQSVAHVADTAVWVAVHVAVLYIVHVESYIEKWQHAGECDIVERKGPL
jgi:hypothetical protein